MDNLTPITREEMLMNDEPMTPITREEKILAGEDLNPVTRREYFLKKYRHAGGDVMVEGLEVTANGTYTAPEGKAYSPVEVAVPLPDNAYLLKTASGSLVSFSDGADLPIPSFVCNIDAVQDLHGYDAPWVGGAGKNKFNISVENAKVRSTDGTWNEDVYTYRGVTFAFAKDNGGNVISITANGAPTGGNAILKIDVSLDSVNYRINGCSGGSQTTYQFQLCKNDGSAVLNNYNGEEGITSEQATNTKQIQIIIRQGYTANNLVFYPMVRLATETDPTFVPYSNICPISGHTGVDAWVRGKNLFDISNAVNATNVVDSVEADGTIHFKDVMATWSNTHIGKIYVVKGQTYVISASNIQYGRIGFSTSPTIYPTNSTFPNIIVQNGVSPSWIIGRAPTTRYFVANFTGYIYLFYCSDANYDNYHAPFATQIQIELGETATTYEPYNPQSQTIQVSWQTEAGEVFGGYVDLVSGELTVDKAGVDMGTLTWIKDSSANNSRYVAQRSGIKSNSTIISDIFKPATYSEVYYHRVDEAIATHDTYAQIVIHSSTFEAEYDADGFKTQMSGHYAVYELATPQTYQLTPTQIKSLLGNNNAWCDTGDVDIDYFAKEV